MEYDKMPVDIVKENGYIPPPCVCRNACLRAATRTETAKEGPRGGCSCRAWQVKCRPERKCAPGKVTCSNLPTQNEKDALPQTHRPKKRKSNEPLLRSTESLLRPGPATEPTEKPGRATDPTEKPGPSTEALEGPGPSTEALEGPGPSTEALEGPGPSTEALEGPGPSTEALEGRGPFTEAIARHGTPTEALARRGTPTEALARPGPSTGPLAVNHTKKTTRAKKTVGSRATATLRPATSAPQSEAELQEALTRRVAEYENLARTATRKKLEQFFCFVAAKNPEAVAMLKDFDEQDENGSPETPSPSGDTPGYCVCTQCKQMPTVVENKCCRQIPCISSGALFEIVCLIEEVILMTMRFRREATIMNRVEPINKNFRYHAYRNFTLMQYGILGRGRRLVILACCVSKIRAKFPSPNGQYIAYEEGELPDGY